MTETVPSEDGERPAEEPGQGVIVAFGRQLKLLRVRAGVSREELGAQVGYSAHSIASFELGRRTPPPRFIEQVDVILDARGLLVAMKDEVARAQYPPFFRDVARLEQEAVELLAYDTHIIKGLLQTEEFMRAVLALRRPLLDEETIEQRVAARLARQEIFERWPAPLLSFVLEEAVLRRRFGGASVLRRQLEHLLDIGEKRNVQIQVMPTEQEDNAGVDGSFTLITKKDGAKFVYLEAQGHSRLLIDQEQTQLAAARYGIIRSQALSPRASLRFIETLLGEL